MCILTFNYNRNNFLNNQNLNKNIIKYFQTGRCQNQCCLASRLLKCIFFNFENVIQAGTLVIQFVPRSA